MCNLLYLLIYRIITTRQYYFKLMDNSLNKSQSVYNLKIHIIKKKKNVGNQLSTMQKHIFTSIIYCNNSE